MGFSEKVQKLRKENNMSQEQLALQLNVSRQAISKWEMGTIPDIKNVVKISSFFDCSLDYLLSEEEKDDDEDKEHEDEENKFSLKKKIKYRDVFVVVGMMLPIISMGIIHILSKVYPVPIVRKSSEGGYYVGVNGFIDYYSLQTWIWISLGIFLISLFIYCFRPNRSSFYKKDTLAKKSLCIVGIGFSILAFLSSVYCWELVNKPITYYSAIEIILILSSILIASSMIKTGKKEIGE